MGSFFVLTLYLQQVRGDSALLTGLALLPQTGVIVFGSCLGGRVTSRSSYSVASTMKSWPRPRSTRSAVRSCSPAWLACATRSRSNGSCRVSLGNS